MGRSKVRTICIFVALAVLLVGTGDVLARKVEDIFGGKVLILKKRPPTYFKTKGGFVSFLRNNQVRTVYEQEDHTWSFETMAFFKRPLGDYEVDMVFYDVTDGKSEAARKFADSYQQNTMDRNTRILSHKARLTRPSFDAKRSYMIVVQSRGREVAKGYFSTKGVTQAAIDQQKRMEHEMKKMEESMKDLQKKVKEQEEREKKEDEEAAKDLF